MSNLQPIDLRGAKIKTRSSSAISRKVIIGLLATLIALSMAVWLGFLGWGVFELLLSFATWIRSI